MVPSRSSPLEGYAMEVRPRIDQALASYCRFGEGCPAQLGEAIRYSLLADGKRLRPLLVLMAAEACGGTMEGAIPAACAVEMVHAYSLIHDDLPAMDDDDLRRGRPTNHKVYGEAAAILAGDALLSMAFEVLARDTRPAEVAAACCAVLAQAAGPTALVGGQSDDLAMAAGTVELPGEAGARLARLESIHQRKTGAMFLAALKLGALTARGSAESMAMLQEYGRCLGLSFQIMDDLLDVHGDERAVGKRVGKDADRGKLTFPSLLGAGESRARAERLIAQACEALAPLGAPAEGLARLARYVVERDR